MAMNARLFYCLACSLSCSLGSVPSAVALSDASLETCRDAFETRRDAAFEALRAKPLKVAEKRAPLGPGRAPYTRHYTYSITDFAMRAFWLNDQVDIANTALAENCDYYIASRAARDDRDSFYWAIDVVLRMVEFYGENGTRVAGRLSSETEAKVYEMMWLYANDHADLSKAEYALSKTWHVWESENHHLQIFSTLWQFNKLLKDAPTYRDRTFADGHTPAEHYAAWTAYAKEYMRERARKGLFIESANGGYGFMSLKGIYSMYDFAEDAELKALAGKLLDLYWATWGEESIDGVRGGGKSRLYQGGSSRVGTYGIYPLLWFYAGIGKSVSLSGNFFTPLTSDYRLPLVVLDLMLDTEGRGVYEIRQRRMGLVQEGFYGPPDYRMRTDRGGIVRQSYCTPDFILGTQLLEARPHEDWAMISSQNRWHGVIFRGHPNARIFPQCKAPGNTYNQQWSVQSKGSLIAQRLPEGTHARGTQAMRVWFSEAGLTNRIEADGWSFVEADGAYAAVRPARGGCGWNVGEDPNGGDFLVMEDANTPVIIEVDRKANHASYEAFRVAVTQLPVDWDGDTLHYRGLSDDLLTLHADYAMGPEVNGRPIDYAPEMVFDSPFVRSEWNSGLVTVRKDARELVLDFREGGRETP
jgi:hypothetical protein